MFGRENAGSPAERRCTTATTATTTSEADQKGKEKNNEAYNQNRSGSDRCSWRGGCHCKGPEEQKIIFPKYKTKLKTKTP